MKQALLTEFLSEPMQILPIGVEIQLSLNQNFISENVVQNAFDILAEAKKAGVEVNKTKVNKLFSKIITKFVLNLTKNPEIMKAERINELFDMIDKLELDIDIQEAQNSLFDYIFNTFGEALTGEKQENYTQEFVYEIFKLAENLNIDIQLYKDLYVKNKLMQIFAISH